MTGIEIHTILKSFTNIVKAAPMDSRLRHSEAGHQRLSVPWSDDPAMPEPRMLPRGCAAPLAIKGPCPFGRLNRDWRRRANHRPGNGLVPVGSPRVTTALPGRPEGWGYGGHVGAPN